jgi:hypothetical protein
MNVFDTGALELRIPARIVGVRLSSRREQPLAQPLEFREGLFTLADRLDHIDGTTAQLSQAVLECTALLFNRNADRE